MCTQATVFSGKVTSAQRGPWLIMSMLPVAVPSLKESLSLLIWLLSDALCLRSHTATLKIDEVVVLGEVTLTSSAMHLLLERNIEITCYVIAYDIPNDKRHTKVHKILLGYGKWTQYSLFECFLTKKQLLLLQAKLKEHLQIEEDSVRFYPQCANCVSKVETVGGPPPADEVPFVV